MTKILYVEDDALVARLYGEKLAQAGFHVLVVHDGLAAMKQLLEFKPDLVVLDLLMPKMTGGDVLKFIRANKEFAPLRVVVFSNSFLSHLTEQVAATRIERVLNKASVTPTQLVAAVREVLASPLAIFPKPTSTTAPASDSNGTQPRPSEVKLPATVMEPPTFTPTGDGEAEFRSLVRREFSERTAVIVQSVRQLCRDFIEAADCHDQLKRLEELARKIGFLSNMTCIAGCYRLAQLSSALEALLLELRERPHLINDSSRHTIAVTVAFLTDQLESAHHPEEQPPAPASALMVDDDPVSNRAIEMALGRANLRGTSVTDPLEGLDKLKQGRYDLVFLDVNMPGLDGIELCGQMRRLPHYKRTPAIFVTSQTDFKTRARSILSGGDDLITKPVLPIELVVKAITLLLKKSGDVPARQNNVAAP